MSAEESAERLYRLLKAALSENAQQRQHAEQALRQAEEHHDYFASMVSIATAAEDHAEEQVRWLAAVCGKNAVTRSWRRHTRTNAVTEDERNYVREQLLSGLGSKESTLATQISVWIALVGRSDFPRYWPSLITDLCDALRAQDQAVMLHALVTLDMVLKQLATKRLISDRSALFRVAPRCFSILCEHFMKHLQALLQSQGAPEALQLSFRVLERCLKSVRRLLMYGCRELNDLAQAEEIFAQIVKFPDVFLRGARGGTEVQTRLSLLAAKLIRVTQEKHPVQFKAFLPHFLETSFQALVEFDATISSDRTCYHIAGFLRNVLECPSYEISISSTEEFKRERLAGKPPPQGVSGASCRFIILSFFDENRINRLIEAMVSKIFILNDGELNTWMNDPETLVKGEEAASWGTANLRYESELLFKILVLREKGRIVPMILELTESVSKDQPLLLDACYRAVGQAAYNLQGAFVFEDWLNGRLSVLLNADSSSILGERILKARAVWLVGQFVEQLTRDTRQQVTPVLVKLMSSSDDDPIVALTAAKVIRTLAEDVHFHAGDFSPYLEKSLLSYFRLLCAAETYETKDLLLQGVIALVERCRAKYIIPYIDLIAAAMPEVWEHRQHAGFGEDTSGQENMLRLSIVSLLSVLVSNTGPASLESANMRKVIYLVMDFATDSSQGKGGCFMMEDGIALWDSVLRSSTEYSEELAAFFPRAIAILAQDYQNLKEILGILKSYCLLGRETFMNQYGANMLNTLGAALGSVNDRGCLAACEVLDLILQLFHVEGVQFTAEILKQCFEKVCSHNESQVLTATYVGLLARGTLVNVGDVEKLVLDGNEMAGVQLVDEMVRNVDSMFRLQRRRLLVVAVVGLMTRYCLNNEVLQRLPLVLNGVVQILAEEKNLRDKRSRRHSDTGREFREVLARFDEDGGPSYAGNGHNSGPRNLVLPGQEREEALIENDICSKVDLRDACMELMITVKSHGQQRYEQVLSQTDGSVLQKLETLLQK